jgi:hypothetical protein
LGKAGYACAHVSRTDEANGRMAVVSHLATTVQDADYEGEPPEQAAGPNSSVRPRPGGNGDEGSVLCRSSGADEQTRVRLEEADASERSRLIADIGRLISCPTVPEATRLAGLTLIGWLARRRPEEPAHAVGVEEARKSERRRQAARAKAR